MKKIVPFKKEIIFKDNLSEITSISLEHTLSVENNSVIGEFIVSGEYKVTSTSTSVEPFSYNLPFEISLDERYILDRANIDIDDFYYEIINDKVLAVNIEILIDKLEEKELVTLDNLDRDDKVENIEETRVETKVDKKIEVQDKIDVQDKIVDNVEKRCIEKEDDISINSIIDDMEDSREAYKSYSVYIIREGDSIEAVMEKYSVTKEELEDYNDLKEVKIGDKIIIPCNV